VRIPGSISSTAFEGGHPALDFVNSVHSWVEDAPRDYWPTAEALIAWHQHRGLISPDTADAFLALSPAAGRRLLGSARELRGKLHELFAGIAATGRAEPAMLGRLDEGLAGFAAFRHLEDRGGEVVWTVRPDVSAPDSLLAPALFAAAGLLTTADFDRIRACPPPHGCGWLFLDTSRNGRRVWCSMRTCGNAAKVRRFRERTTGA